MGKNSLALIGLSLFSFICAVLILTHPPKIGGDIVEYLGITQTLSSHATLDLKESDKAVIKKIIGPIYQENGEYYLEGRNNLRYPTHFPLYSILAMPIRTALHIFHLNELLSFSLLNLLILFLTGLFCLKNGFKQESEKIPFLLLLLVSPVFFYITWPGPELLIICLLLAGIFLLKNGRSTLGILFMIIASWQSQPLLLIPLAVLLNQTVTGYKKHGLQKKNLALALFLAVPNIYYFFLFNSPTAFAKLAGFGLSNFTMQKPLELFFDPNFGLFFYAPLLFIFGIVGIIHYKKKGLLPFLLICACTSVLYTTITNWNHGAPGYGPNRYSLFLIPFLLFLGTSFVAKSRWKDQLLVLLLVIQIPILIFNGLLFPNYNDSFGHASGDLVLREVAQVLAGKMEEEKGTLFRYGGEEIAGAVRSTSLFEQDRIGRELVASIRALGLPHAKECPSDIITISVGISMYDPKTNPVDRLTLLTQADKALYAAKSSGKNRFRVHKPNL